MDNRVTLRRELSLLAAALLIGIVAAEAFLRFFAPQSLLSPAYTDRFGDVGWMANARIKNKTAEYDVVYNTNDMGFRGRNYSFRKPPNTYRIVMLGTCFTFGTGVNDEETYSAQLESKLNAASTGIKYEVLNLSPGGGCLGNQEFWYRRVGAFYHPDLVVVHFFFWNPLEYSYVAKKVVLAANPVRLKQARLRRLIRYFPGYVWLCENSHLWALIRLNLQTEQNVAEGEQWQKAGVGRSPEELERTGIDTYEDLKGRVCEGNAKLLLFTQNGVLDHFPLLKAHVLHEAQTDPCVSFLDFKMEPGYTISPKDFHWSPRGHGFVADRLIRFLRAKRLINLDSSVKRQ